MKLLNSYNTFWRVKLSAYQMAISGENHCRIQWTNRTYFLDSTLLDFCYDCAAILQPCPLVFKGNKRPHNVPDFVLSALYPHNNPRRYC